MAGNPPIGRPIPGVTAVIVDDECRVLPRGAVGKLLIAGPTLADGYLVMRPPRRRRS
ncbi:AMP-binding protein [Paeniglutamicibacter kerguelensis]|uniref:AMP-binding protein n=1 Tax=Paeniglutamicibacter kerguelensis TaxID=254788 RepID=UPI00360B7074